MERRDFRRAKRDHPPGAAASPPPKFPDDRDIAATTRGCRWTPGIPQGIRLGECSPERFAFGKISDSFDDQLLGAEALAKEDQPPPQRPP